MKIVLFDQINETHVVDSLAAALVAGGHAVSSTGAVWRGHRFPQRAEDILMIHDKIDELLAESPDVLFNFRASSLLPEHVERLRRAGIRCLVWFPDDPVLYKSVYGQVIDLYDTPLHCGDQRILAFYQYRGHKPGINFPFWLDPGVFRYAYDPSNASGDVVFFGNMHGPAKEGRYETVTSLHEDVSIYGKVPLDPGGCGKGILQGIPETVATLGRYRIGINIAQQFSSYAGTSHEFPGLAMLGGFFLPSRVIQYAAIGLPVLTIQSVRPDNAHYPPSLHARDALTARNMIKRVLEDTGYLVSISKAARRIVEERFCAHARARLLEYLINRGSLDYLTSNELEFMYQWY